MYHIKVYQLIYPKNDKIRYRKTINGKINKRLIASYISSKEKLSQDYTNIFNQYKHIRNIHIDF